ncbi:MAG: ECF transporter S component [Peptoniphilus sp.]|nr:ECF transporter S component [Peptoniphilus sp.]MDD7363034.1 ECF transporter S component [Bacillota bacterium]MDY6045299.1 ECF transporter S component [Peptoniphilus sp.]
MKKLKKNRLSARQIVDIGILGAITVVLGLTPLGFVPIGPLNATTMHIPVLIAAFIDGPVVGGFVGLIFGLSSLFNAITRPTPISFVFYNPLISILPRVLLGILAYYLFRALNRVDGKHLRRIALVAWIAAMIFLAWGIYRDIATSTFGAGFVLNILFLILSAGLLYLIYKSESKSASVVLSAFIATVIHSAMVMGGIYLFFAERFVSAMGAPTDIVNVVIFGTIITSGVPEGILAGIVSTGVVSGWSMSKKN